MTTENFISFDDETIDRLQAIEDCPKTDFKTLAALSGLDPAYAYRGADLRGQDFRGADLNGYDFTGARLESAVWDDPPRHQGAILKDTIWDEAAKLVHYLLVPHANQTALPLDPSLHPAKALEYQSLVVHLRSQNYIYHSGNTLAEPLKFALFLLHPDSFQEGDAQSEALANIQRRDDYGVESCPVFFARLRGTRFSQKQQRKVITRLRRFEVELSEAHFDEPNLHPEFADLVIFDAQGHLSLLRQRIESLLESPEYQETMRFRQIYLNRIGAVDGAEFAGPVWSPIHKPLHTEVDDTSTEGVKFWWIKLFTARDTGFLSNKDRQKLVTKSFDLSVSSSNFAVRKLSARSGLVGAPCFRAASSFDKQEIDTGLGFASTMANDPSGFVRRYAWMAHLNCLIDALLRGKEADELPVLTEKLNPKTEIVRNRRLVQYVMDIPHVIAHGGQVELDFMRGLAADGDLLLARSLRLEIERRYGKHDEPVD